jgi:hypothetical protein
VELIDPTLESLGLRAKVVVHRTAFGMTWSPLKMASSEAHAVVSARFVKS